jgi:hypothetical protein
MLQGAGWTDHFETRFSRELERISGVKPGSARGQSVLSAGVSVFEELLGQIQRVLASENSALSRELANASSERRALERQLGIANEAARNANRTGRGRLLQIAAKPLGALLLAITGGVASGVGQEVWAQRTPATITASEWAEGCETLVAVFDEQAVFGAIRWAETFDPLRDSPLSRLQHGWKPKRLQRRPLTLRSGDSTPNPS